MMSAPHPSLPGTIQPRRFSRVAAARRESTLVLAVHAVVLVAFLNAGIFKGDRALTALPVDLTVLLASFSVLFSVWHLLSRGFPSVRAMQWLGAIFAAFAMPLFWTDFSPGTYSLSKSMGLVITALAAVTPLVLIRTERALRVFFVVHGLFALFLTAEGIAMLLGEGPGWNRLSVHNSSTITLGRIVAQACLWLLALLLFNRKSRQILLAGTIAVMLLVGVAAGSRGPLFAFVLIAGGLLIYALGGQKRLARTLLVLLLLVGSLVVAVPVIAPSQSLGRISAFFGGGERTTGREELFAVGRREAFVHPLGAGWGSSQQWSPFGNSRFYFHNIVLEVSLEGGWLAVTLLLAAFASAVRSSLGSFRRVRSPERACLLAVLLFYGMQAQISGDINDNRWLFATLGLALALSGRPRPAVPVTITHRNSLP